MTSIPTWKIDKRDPDNKIIVNLADYIGVSCDYSLKNEDSKLEDLNNAIEWASNVLGQDVKPFIENGTIKEVELVESYKKSMELEENIKKILEE